MRRLRTLWLMALAAMALIALAAAGNASATLLCETNTTPCTSAYAEETDIHSTTTTHTTLKLAAGNVTCTEEIVTEDYRRYWWNKVTTADYTNCNNKTCTLTTLKNGEVEYQNTEGANGILVSKEMELKSTCSGISCNFATGSTGTTLGKITGGNPATVAVEAKLPYVGGAGILPCTGGSGSATLTSALKITSPAPLYVVKE